MAKNIGNICNNTYPPSCSPLYAPMQSFDDDASTADECRSASVLECSVCCDSFYDHVSQATNWQNCVNACLGFGSPDPSISPGGIIGPDAEPADSAAIISTCETYCNDHATPGSSIWKACYENCLTGQSAATADDEYPACPSAEDYEDCLASKCCGTGPECLDDIGGDDDDDDGFCPSNPEKCVTGCCCCDSSIMAEQLGARCYDLIGASCNFDGSGPSPGETFPEDCTLCTETCSLILAGQCGNLNPTDWGLPYASCVCTCLQPMTTEISDTFSSPTTTGVIGELKDYEIVGNTTYAAGSFLEGSFDEDATQNSLYGIVQSSGTSWEKVGNDATLMDAPFVVSQDNNLYTARNEIYETREYMDMPATSPPASNYDFRNEGVINLFDLLDIRDRYYIAMEWNGSSWSQIGRLPKSVIENASQGSTFVCAISFDDELYYGGTALSNITQPDGTSLALSSNLIHWDGTNWDDIGDTLGITGNITALAASSTELLIMTSNNVFTWDGAAAAATAIAPNGVDGTIYSAVRFENQWIVTGDFASVNDVTSRNLISYDGTNWVAYAQPGPNQAVQTINVYNSMLYMGGSFTTAGGEGFSYFARYDGTDWCLVSGVKSSISEETKVNALALESNGLRVGGAFSQAGDVAANSDALFTADADSCNLVQSSCWLHCAVCGKCDADVTVSNTSCNYQFTLTPSASCSRENTYENVYIGIRNQGSLRATREEKNLVGSVLFRLQNAISENDYLHYMPHNSWKQFYLIDGPSPENPCIQCEDESGNIVCSPCPPSCCPEGLSNNQFSHSVADDICAIANNRTDQPSNSRYEFIILAHGYVDQCSVGYAFPCPEGYDYWVNLHSKIASALSVIHARIHVIQFVTPCLLSEFVVSSGGVECSMMECCAAWPPGECSFMYTDALSPECGVSSTDPTGICATLGASGTVPRYCELAAFIGAHTPWTPDQANDLYDDVVQLNHRPPASSTCLPTTTYTVTLDSMDCSSRDVDICGTIQHIEAGDHSVCCDQIGCHCSTECPPFWYDPACDEPPDCKCGVECEPVCDTTGNPLFPTLKAAQEANWAHCCMHALEHVPSQGLMPPAETCMDLDCITIDFSQPWEDPDIRQVCRTEIDAEVESEWLRCGGIGGDDDDDDDDDDEDDDGDDPPPFRIPGCGIWPPTNTFCNTDTVIGQEAGCTSVRHPDVVVLNNGIGLVAYEDTTDNSVIRVRQLHTSIANKVQPNRRLRFGRLENPSKWRDPPTPGEGETGFPESSALCRLYYYEPIGDITTWSSSSQEEADQLFFLSGPFKFQRFDIWDISVDDVGEYIEILVPSTDFEGWAWNIIMNAYGSQGDDRYDVRWMTYDQSDFYDTGDNADGDYIGTTYTDSTVPAGVDPALDATVSDNNVALELPPHFYNGEKVPVAYPSITNLDNYDNENENAHFIYVAYQAFEDSRWKVYLRQLRLSEFRKASSVLLVNSNLETLSDAGITSIIWQCRTSCIIYDCEGDEKSATITSVWTAKTSTGLSVYNMNLPLGSNTICSQLYPKNILTVVLAQQTVWNASNSECPNEDMLMNWKMGDEITTTVPSFGTSLDQDEINTWSRNNFNVGFSAMPVNDEITSNPISCQLIYHSSQGGGWGVFQEDTVETASAYKGIYVSDPVLVYNPDDGHCTRPMVMADYANRIFIAFEATESGLHQIKLVGTAEPENSLPIGSDSTWYSLTESFDQAFNFFYSTDDFTYTNSITTTGTNQHPRMFIDLNNVIHLTWHSDKDNQWEIYYANSDNDFTHVRITKHDSKSLNPDIYGTNGGNLFIVWHDDRFGPWEIMIAYFDGSRIKPLFQQNEYLASFRNRYTHSINLVPVIVTNETANTVCFTDILVDFYRERTHERLRFTVKRSDYPFAFTENFALETGDEFITAGQYCVAPGETLEFTLSLTPEIFVNPDLTSTTELSVGLKQNQAYFTQVRILTTGSEFLTMPEQYQSTSCTDCTGVPMRYDHSACAVPIPITNSFTNARYLNLRVNFYTSSALDNLVASIEAAPGQDLEAFSVKGERADGVWGASGFRLDAGERVDVQCFPALSQAHGLLCGYNYYIKVAACYGTSSTTPCTDYVDISPRASYWTCNCQSVRWTDDAAITISELNRWMSSGFGFSDTRVTISPGNSLNPKIKMYRTNEGVIIYQDDRHKSGEYLIYGSIFRRWPRSNMRASGTMHSSDIFENQGVILGGQNPTFDIDTYHNVFLAYENNQSSPNLTTYGERKDFQDNTQTSITVRTCGFTTSFIDDSIDPCIPFEDPAKKASYLLGYPAVEAGLLFAEIIKQFRIKNDYIRYHITRNRTPTAVVKQAQVLFDIIGTPDVVAVRLRNEENEWSVWMPFDPQLGDYHAEIPWELSAGSGLKTIRMQVATYQGVATSATISIIADYDSIDYQIRLYSSAARLDADELNTFENIPVASILLVNKTQPETQEIFVDIIPNASYLQYLETNYNPAVDKPTFSVFTQGSADILDQTTTWNANTNLFQGSFTINRRASDINQDGVAMIVPRFFRDPSGTLQEDIVEINKYNRFRETLPAVEELARDALGRYEHLITSRPVPQEDPYFVFGDPNYRLHKENQ